MSTLFGLIAFVSFVCALIGLAKPNVFNRLSKKPMTRLRSLGMFGGIFFLSFILAAAASPSQPASDSQNDTVVVQTNTISYVTEENSPEREIEKVVIDLLGEKSNEDASHVRNVETFEDVTLIEYNADGNLTSGMTRRGIWLDVIKIVKKISTDPAIESITVNAYIKLVDQYGNEAPGKVMTVNLTKDTWSKINWDNFITDNLPEVADLYWVHPAIND